MTASYMVQLPENIQSARLLLVHKRPYLGALIWSLIPVQRNTESGLDTMAVDRWGRWYINIEEVAKWPIPKVALGIIHECNHLLRRHHDRMQTFAEWMTPSGTTLANWGGDLEINDGLAEEAKDFNTQPPEGWLYPKTFGFPDGLLAEEYCDKLLKKAQKDGRCFHMNHPGQGGKKQPGQSQPGDGKGDGKTGQGAGGGVGSGRCGSCSGEGKAPWEEDAPKGQAKDGSGESNVPGLTGAEIDVLRRQVAQSVKNHSASRGDVPMGWKRWAEVELTAPKIPWTRELAAVIRRVQSDLAGMVDYSWKRLSRRSTPEILLPGLRKPKVEAVGVIDTSGSMGDEDIGRALREFAGVMKVVGLEGIRYIAVDAAAHISKRVFKPSQIQLAGGGGTDMRVGIEAALKMKPAPDYIIVFTDGYTPWPEHPPADRTRVIAVLVQQGAAMPPGWIRSLYVN